MKKVIKKFGKKGYSFFKKSTCIILIGLSVQSFLFKMPYFIVLGVMLLSVSLTLSSWFNKILLSRSINLSILNKIFIIIGNILIAAYSLEPYEKNYFKCIIPILLIFLSWILTITYVKNKSKKD